MSIALHSLSRTSDWHLLGFQSRRRKCLTGRGLRSLAGTLDILIPELQADGPAY